ncbi:hypothetical protein PPL_08635 [Heterostelium album PN500]|uniref:Uncharacterized protein n=1 Tax=Heterostelium pallidum (strain ATCC 26659 / Pp 5 / PN500) TaxID=670386 RepID=D3BJB0_HETP5|nr:hypothetical protein PPL_08635 [Heterostelium album PN500]EFA77990.1 hypothetical protein PPL_08635 [Heterostelium album PN500]|eukprot:XP_020430118.1 hypothetical protein PPL_08635 [Heterostelium album PN500]
MEHFNSVQSFDDFPTERFKEQLEVLSTSKESIDKATQFVVENVSVIDDLFEVLLNRMRKVCVMSKVEENSILRKKERGREECIWEKNNIFDDTLLSKANSILSGTINYKKQFKLSDWSFDDIDMTNYYFESSNNNNNNNDNNNNNINFHQSHQQNSMNIDQFNYNTTADNYNSNSNSYQNNNNNVDFKQPQQQQHTNFNNNDNNQPMNIDYQQDRPYSPNSTNNYQLLFDYRI